MIRSGARTVPAEADIFWHVVCRIGLRNGRAPRHREMDHTASLEVKTPMAGESKTTTNHQEIKKWVEARGGKPATVKRTGGKDDAGILRINFEGYSGEESLEEISWEEFFDKFEEKELAFLYQDKTKEGKESRFFKFVNRD